MPSPSPAAATESRAAAIDVGADVVRPSKAERTREALRAAALRRFVDEGFDAATVVDIAADVGVTERTFYRHFATKDEVLFGDFEQRLGWFRDALLDRPATESLVDSCMAALTSFPGDPRLMLEVAKLRESLLSRDRIARYLRELQGLLAAELRAVAVDRSGSSGSGTALDRDDDLLATVHAEILSATVFAAVGVWTDRGGRTLDDLARITEQALEIARPAIRPG